MLLLYLLLVLIFYQPCAEPHHPCLVHLWCVPLAIDHQLVMSSCCASNTCVPSPGHWSSTTTTPHTVTVSFKRLTAELHQLVSASFSVWYEPVGSCPFENILTGTALMCQNRSSSLPWHGRLSKYLSVRFGCRFVNLFFKVIFFLSPDLIIIWSIGVT